MRFVPANDSSVFRRGFQRAARRHGLWSRRNSGPLDETGRRVPGWQRPVESRVARADPTWGIVSRLNGCHQRELKLVRASLVQRLAMEAEDRGLI